MIRHIGTADQEYSEFLESDYNSGSQEITGAYDAMIGAFEEYLCLVQENAWKDAFNYAIKRIQDVTQNDSHILSNGQTGR